MVVKAQLKVQLLANDVVIAESDSSALWQSVLRAIEEGRPAETYRSTVSAVPVSASVAEDRNSQHPAGDNVSQFARELRIEPAVLESACAPSIEPPYIQLDRHHWEALRKNTPERGASAVSPVVLAATLLALWWRRAGKQGTPNTSDIKPVLDTIHLSGFNTSRTLENCRWLQVRGKSITLNPSKTSAAIAVARAYCLQVPVERDDD